MSSTIDWIELGRRMIGQLESRTPDCAATIREEPSTFYTDPGRFADEYRRIFLESPIFAATSAEIAEPGAYHTLEIAGVPLLLVRGDDGRVRGFRNTCRHRGAKLLEGSGCGLRTITCPYHAWSYDKQGNLTGMPFSQGFAGVGKETHSLHEIQVAEAHGLIFVQVTGGQQLDLDKHLGSLGAELASHGWDRWHAANQDSTQVMASWKLTMDTYGECYHCSILHRDTLPGLAGNLGGLDYYGPHIRQVFIDRGLKKLAGLPESEWEPRNIKERTAIVYLVFPNLVLASNAGGLQVMTVRPGDSIDRSVVHQVQLFPPELSNVARTHSEEFLQMNWRAVVCAQDFPLIENIWKSLKAGSIDKLTFGRNEASLQHLHAAWDEFMDISH